MLNRARRATLLAGTIITGSLLATPVLAQAPGQQGGPSLQAEPDEAADLDSGNMIIVTGSRIQRRNTDSAAPIAVVTGEEFQLSGTVNVESVINTLPQVIPGTTSFSNNPSNGAATLNLRGLGSVRTLVLVNGRRYMFFDTNQIVDLNTIPSFLIDSVDVVTGGASAVYGSDAMAGVVNFRLRNVVGAELGAQVSSTQEADGFRYELTGALGSEFADGRGHATAFAEYYKRESIFQGERGFSTFQLNDDGDGNLVQAGSSFVPQTRFVYRGDGNTAGTPFGGNAIFDPAGTARPYVASEDFYNFNPVNYLQIPQERFLLGGYADYDIGGGHELFGEVSFVNNRVATELAPTPVQVNTPLDLASIQPFVSAATYQQFLQLDASETGAAMNDGLINVQVNRRLLEGGSRNQVDERNAFRVLAGLRGPIGEYLSYDAYYSYARTRNSQVQQGNVSLSRFASGLDGTGDLPINIFGLNSLTPAMADSFIIQAQNTDISSLEVGTVAVSGTFGDFALGAAEPAGFAVGGEWRRVASAYLPDEFLASGDVAGFNAGEPTSGDYSVREVFAELNIPFETESGMRIELTGAGRYSDYSLDAVGGVWTYAGGIEFAPVPDITFRGQYARAIRAPNVAELFQGSAIGFPQAVDPCTTAAATSGALSALCQANGVPVGNLGAGVPSTVQPDVQIAALFGGNPNLEEETSDSWTGGVVVQPRFIPGLTITADYFDITINNAITTIVLQTALDLCFQGTQNLNTPQCANFVGTRDSTGAFSRVTPPTLGGANIAQFAVSGIDLELAYGLSLPFSALTDTGESNLNLSFLGTWNDSQFISPDVTDPTQAYDCAGKFGITCDEPTPEFKWTARASVIDGPLTTSVRWRHIGSADDDDDTFVYAIEKIDAYDLLDLTLGLDFLDKYTVTFGVRNLLNTLPDTPRFQGNTVVNNTNSLLVGSNDQQANTYPNTYDVLGRDFFLSIAARF